MTMSDFAILIDNFRSWHFCAKTESSWGKAEQKNVYICVHENCIALYVSDR